MSTAIAEKRLSTKPAELDAHQRARQSKAHPDCRSTTIKLTGHANIACVIVGPRQSSSRRDRRNGHPDCRCVLIQIVALQSAIFQPFITAVNSIPRIALAPIIVLAFGIGDTSKVVTSWIVVVFLVFFNTFEGARSIDEGFVNVARLLGASEWQITRTVVIPSTMAWVFASLSPAISFALIGVIVGEFIGAERGI